MDRVFLTFLGTGDYREASYSWEGRVLRPTPFAQAAMLEYLTPASFDRIIIVATPTSREKHLSRLKSLLKAMGSVEPFLLEISEELDPRAQWQSFEDINQVIGMGDRLTVDITHGWRLFPVILSSALYFLQKARGITLEAVLYGAYEPHQEVHPIIDLKDFYIINEYAEAVSRLVEDADARKLARVSELTPAFQAGEMNDPAVVAALNSLTDAIRNVDVNGVPRRAEEALRLMEEKKEKAQPTAALLLDLVVDKFVDLSGRVPGAGRFSRDYFRIQLKICRLLLDHRLFMQAYAVMREFVGSLGENRARRAIEADDTLNAKKRGKYLYYSRKWFGEPFLGLLLRDKEKWGFKKDYDPDGARFEKYAVPFYFQLEEAGLDGRFRALMKTLADYRNGFSHAWTAHKKVYADIEEKGIQLLAELEELYEELCGLGLVEP